MVNETVVVWSFVLLVLLAMIVEIRVWWGGGSTLGFRCILTLLPWFTYHAISQDHL
jgi:hypothetical protein